MIFIKAKSIIILSNGSLILYRKNYIKFKSFRFVQKDLFIKNTDQNFFSKAKQFLSYKNQYFKIF